MGRIAIGVMGCQDPQRLRVTLDSLRTSTALAYELVPLGDDGARLGGAACFNRLAAGTTAEVVVLLEAGSLCGPGWLERLVAALENDPRNGLAGPSTNLIWNEQQIVSGAADPERHAEEAARRFGSATRTLEPLYSLGDFCYAARRDAINATGSADEAYGEGPCWEMDYNIRAARAGWRGVWVCGAYVGRMPIAPQRQRREAELFERNKQLYQSKFCGRQLQGGRAPFRSHCSGDRCPNFAPSRAMPTAIPLDRGLVTCLMPTANRPDWVARSIGLFLSQDYPQRELLILDDGTEPVAHLVPDDARIRYHRLPRKLTVGAKRNAGCELARGEWIAHWDDDDWYPADRLSRQCNAARTDQFDACGSSELYFLDRARKEAFHYSYAGGGRAWVAGSTLFYRKSFWAKHRFRDVQVGEDAHFVWGVQPGRVLDLRDPSLCVASLHSTNTSRKNTAGAYWKSTEFRWIEELAENPARRTSAAPLISCIMPTANRRHFLPLAFKGLRSQSYPNWELIVVDDGSDCVRDAVSHCEQVRYIRLNHRASIGEKRNIACQEARGEIIAHWDDDDWYGSERLALQAAPILRGEADITGLVNTHLLVLPSAVFWTPSDDLHRRMYLGDVAGATLMYWKRLWTAVRFPAVNLAEDAMLLRESLRQGHRLLQLPGAGLFVYVRHGRNSWKFQPGRFLDPVGWRHSAPPAAFPAELVDDYRRAVQTSARVLQVAR